MQSLNIHVDQIATAAIQNKEQFGSLQGSEECNQSESSFYKKLQEVLHKESEPSQHTKDTVSNTQNSQQIADKADSLSDSVSEKFVAEEKLLRLFTGEIAVTESASLELQKDIAFEEKLSFASDASLVTNEEVALEELVQEILSQDDTSLADSKNVKDLLQFLKKTVVKNNESVEMTEESTDEMFIKDENLGDANSMTEVFPLITNTLQEKGYEQTSELTLEQNEIAEIKIGNKKKTLDEIISVVDERSLSENSLESEKGQLVTSVRYDEQNGTAEMTMNFAPKGNLEENLSVPEGMKQQNASQFQSLLTQELQSNADEFVRAGQIVLKDNNKGTINLVLHPEELGNVKIQLELSDKVITGKIIVASEEAYQAFKSNLGDLRNAFAMSGFENPSFDLSWTGEGGRNNQQSSEQHQYFAKNSAEEIIHALESYEQGSSYGEYDDYSAISIIA